jgi:3-methyladenine DNA glycosylase AlkD
MEDYLLKAADICSRLQELGDPEKARGLQRFFKTGTGEYGEGDQFVGLRVPETRKLARQYQTLSLLENLLLLQSPIHEARLLALLILIKSYQQGDAVLREQIYTRYLQNTRSINNWDLVDVSAEHIVGTHLRCRDRSPLHRLAASSLLWERRIAILSTFHFIKSGEFEETLSIAVLLLHDKEDLIHKAVGWMLREVGKRDRRVEEEFLKRHYQNMPRTMLRYAIEKFEEGLRLRFLRGKI